MVCTHGKRDRCCAKYGRPLYDALRREADSSWVWQSTHVGGDRFAGNVVILPQGLYYGRVEPEDASGLLAAHAAGPRRPRSLPRPAAYPFPVQAAEHAIREADGLVGIDDLRLVRSERRGDDAWRVRFRAPDGAFRSVDVVAEESEQLAYLTCGAAEPAHARRYVATIKR